MPAVLDVDACRSPDDPNLLPARRNSDPPHHVTLFQRLDDLVSVRRIARLHHHLQLRRLPFLAAVARLHMQWHAC
jgi:hypothetical protein